MNNSGPDNRTGDSPIEKMIGRYASNALHRYHGNLAFAVSAIENGFVPDEHDENVRTWMTQLSAMIVESGKPEPDSFLLRYALTVPGMQRGVNPPMIALEENRGGYRPKRHRESAGQIERLQEALSLAVELGIPLPSETEQAIQSLANIMGEFVIRSDDDWFAWFAALDASELDELARRATALLASSTEPIQELGADLLRDIVCFRDDRPLDQAIHSELIRLDCYWPSCLYRDATEAITHTLLQQIENKTKRSHLNHLLLALAWTRNQSTSRAFVQWEQDPPEWSGHLFATPKDYLPHAGLSLNAEGEFESLFNETCFRLTFSRDSKDQSFECRTDTGIECPACGGELCWLFDFTQFTPEATEKVFSGVFANAPRRVPCCLFCGCYQPNFSQLNPDGDVVWLSPLERLDFEGCGETSPVSRQLSLTTSSPYAASEPFAIRDASTIGGMPSWLHNAEYPACVECGSLMRFLAQHDNGAVGEDGIYYAFFCPTCSIACVQYQQT